MKHFMSSLAKNNLHMRAAVTHTDSHSQYTAEVRRARQGLKRERSESPRSLSELHYNQMDDHVPLLFPSLNVGNVKQQQQQASTDLVFLGLEG